ncbi:hemagglutinin repeat-containing protein, partial [Selenomonas noxia]|uniref:hemagglutinin repeat-containing protein n=1 Tax=Selenomonas noxia TaxID=135083 RepID=UPI003C749022
ALTQEAKKQQAQTIALGTTQFSYTRRPPWPRKGRQRRYKSPVFMTPEVARSEPSPIGVGLYEGGIARENLTDEQRRRIHNALSPFGLAPDGFAKGSGAEGPEHLLVSALYRVHPESTAKYLIETDPAFTDRRKFLSSDYIYQRLRWDPDKVPKRIGDGFYEQQLFAEQILRRTGKRHLDGYTDDEAAFQALMDAGISYAAEMNIAPGVALTKEQIEALTSDMIWLEEREVYVRGKKERAVYPVLYMKNTNGLRLTAGGSLISAKNISVETTKALKNAGTLYAENIRAHAGDIENEGLILAKDIALTSDTDIKTTGTIQGESSVLLDAKESIYAQSTTEKLPHQDVLDQTANISVKNDEGTLLMRAGRNIELTGANLSAQGKNGSIQLTAGNDIVLGTNRLQSEKDMTLDASNYLRTKRGTEFVTEIQADGNVNLAAGNDLNIRAAAIASKNADVSLTAGNDVKITSGEESSEDHYAMRYKERGLFSSKTTSIRTDSEERSALSANISGKNIHISAAKDAELQAANVIADGSANISATRNLTLSSAENYARLDHYKEVKKSGIFGSGGLGFTIGTQRTKTDHDREATTQQGTNIAALGGNVSLTAGETAHLTSANVLAGKEASVTAKETTIDGRENVYRESYTKEVKTSGLTVSFGHGLIDLGQEFYAPLKRMGEVEDDRLKAVYAWRTGRLIHDYFGKNALALDKSYTPSLTLSLGSSSSYNRSENVTREYAGSMIRAGELANLTAAERDLTIKGSTVESKDVSLTAKGNVRLEAGENTSVTTTVDKYSSASIGASFGINGLSDISINVNRAKGNSKETYTSYTPALIRAEENAVITSGKDTDILGSKVQGDKVTARVGGNLNIETLQEKETYEEQNTSTGSGISWSMNPLTKHFSKPIIGRDWSKGTIDSHYRSAREQAGFFAGSKGFDIYARENTDLKGGLIASEASPDKNLLSTGTFTFNDLKNEADYRAKSIGAAYHKYGN